MKRGLLQFVQHLAASVFIGIAVYGAIIYWGGETQKKIPATESLLLGLGAVICIIVVVAVGGLMDTMAAANDESESKREDNG
jgi:hypothetical protein